MSIRLKLQSKVSVFGDEIPCLLIFSVVSCLGIESSNHPSGKGLTDDPGWNYQL
jgi:hypothetical protein